ncbi:MAG: SemiSWEET family transporter [Bdellovibrionales bacterium]
MMDLKTLLGWLSSIILLVTILNQVYTQWKKGTSEGVSWFLFVGQMLASVGFVIYSVLVKDMVFIVTNSALALSHIVGLAITWKQKSRKNS